MGFDSGGAAIVDDTASRAQPGYGRAVFANYDIRAVRKMGFPQCGILHWMWADDEFEVAEFGRHCANDANIVR